MRGSRESLFQLRWNNAFHQVPNEKNKPNKILRNAIFPQKGLSELQKLYQLYWLLFVYLITHVRQKMSQTSNKLVLVSTFFFESLPTLTLYPSSYLLCWMYECGHLLIITNNCKTNQHCLLTATQYCCWQFVGIASSDVFNDHISNMISHRIDCLYVTGFGWKGIKFFNDIYFFNIYIYIYKPGGGKMAAQVPLQKERPGDRDAGNKSSVSKTSLEEQGREMGVRAGGTREGRFYKE